MTEERHEEADATADPADGERPHIDVSGALGIAGHEEELLGLEGVPDTGGVLHHPHEPDEPAEAEERIRSAVVNRGISPVD
ncbi:MAG: hypothetical protein ACOYOP_10165 [Microthrixaceae bacterium]